MPYGRVAHMLSRPFDVVHPKWLGIPSLLHSLHKCADRYRLLKNGVTGVRPFDEARAFVGPPDKHSTGE
jgi:hypothetical protein